VQELNIAIAMELSLHRLQQYKKHTPKMKQAPQASEQSIKIQLLMLKLLQQLREILAWKKNPLECQSNEYFISLGQHLRFAGCRPSG
jgi:hypothetical protein